MSIKIIEESVSVLHDYGRISPAFTVESRFAIRPIESGLGGLALELEPVEPPYVKDYDRDNGHGPEGWLEQWDIVHWGVQSAFDGSSRVGGALIAWDTPQIHMLDGRKDLAALWDIRVDGDYRNRGIGSSIFSSAIDWAKERGCTTMKIETQDVNVAACRFYAHQGCKLATIDPFAYADHPEEVQFIWLIDL